MADLNDIQSALSVKVAGAASSGIEDNYMEVDTSGRLTVKLNDGSGSAINLGQALMAASLPVAIASNQSAIPVSQSGTWTTGRTWTLASGTDSVAAVQSGTWTVQPGNTQNTTAWLTQDAADGPVTPGTVASKAMLIAGQFNTALPTLTNTQQSAIQLDSSGRQIIAPLTNTSIVKAQLQDNSGTAITLGQKVMASSVPVVIASDQSTLPISAASLPLPTGAATEVTLAKLPLAQASATSGQSGPLVQGAVTTAAPTYTTGQTDPLSLTTAGALRVDGSAVTQPVSAASLPLPTGAATAANQSTEITSLQLIDDAIHAPNSAINKGIPFMGQLDDTSTSVPTEDQVAVARITAQRSLHTNLRNGSTGAEMIGQKSMATSIPVVLPSDQTITVTSSPLPATGSKFSFGRIVTTSLTSLPVEETTYTEQTVNGQRSIASASASDASAGTGARTVVITYYDQTGAGPFTETLTLNGTTGVNTVSTTMCFIENIKVATVGSTGSNVGIITLFTAINKGGSAIGTIAATDNQTFWCHHYVPTGKTCFISGFSIGNNSASAGAGGTFVLKASTPTVANTPDIQVGDFCTVPGAGSTATRTYQSTIQVVGPARVRAVVTPYATSTVTQFASFDFIDN